MAGELKDIFLGKTSGKVRQTLEEITQPQYSENFYPARAAVHIRTPDVITTRRWISQGEYIKCYCNPSETNWGVARRETFMKTAAGMIRNTWRNRYRNTYLDNFPITFTFQSGNLMPSTGVAIDLNDPDRLLRLAQAPSLPPGLDNFYKFLGLIDQTALNGTSANYHIIVHHTRVFPQIWIEGFFDANSPTWAESSATGNSVNWGATFIVHRTVPKLTSYQVLQTLYQDWLLTSGAIEEQIPITLAKQLKEGKDFYDKLFADWGWGSLPTSNNTQQNPNSVMRTKATDKTAAGAFDNLTIVGQQSENVGTFDARANIIGQGSIGSLSPFDNTTTIGQGGVGGTTLIEGPS